jgi:hypothetical protein
MRSLLHKSTFFGFGIIFLISGCSITSTSYEGFMTFPQNIMFDGANFKYVKTISGSSAAIYSAYGYDKLRVPEGLINSAKSEMYGTHTFMPNQIITNISRDIIRTHSGKGVTSSFSVKVIMSADIYEFSNDGIYSSDKNVSNENFDLTEENIKSSTNDIEIKKEKEDFYNWRDEIISNRSNYLNSLSEKDMKAFLKGELNFFTNQHSPIPSIKGQFIQAQKNGGFSKYEMSSKNKKILNSLSTHLSANKK